MPRTRLNVTTAPLALSNKITLELAWCDAASLRSMRATVAGTATDADRNRAIALEGYAAALREAQTMLANGDTPTLPKRP